MSDSQDTRVWLGGVPVSFVQWMPTGLVYTRVGSTDTAAHLSRSTVKRLIREGMLKFEGYYPDWVYEEYESVEETG